MASLTHVCMWQNNGWKISLLMKQHVFIQVEESLLTADYLCVSYVGNMFC